MRQTRSNVAAAVLCAAMLLAFALTARQAVSEKTATVDEPLHIASAWLQTHWADFRYNCEDPALWKYYVAAGTDPGKLKVGPTGGVWDHQLTYEATSHVAVNALYHAADTDPDAIIGAGRNRMIWLGPILGGLIAIWSWRLAGPVAALVATAAFSLDPNFLAHTALIKNDVAMALFFVAMMLGLWFLGECATLWRWLIVSLLLGAGLTTKFSGILLIPMLGVALLCRALIPAPWPVLMWTAKTISQRLATAIGMGIASLLVAYLLIWACYDFRYSASVDPASPLDVNSILSACATSQSILAHNGPPTISTLEVAQWRKDWQPDAVIRIVQWSMDHQLLPQAWLGGFLYTYGTSHSRNTFLCGEVSLTGWWYYFPLAMLFKTPLATLIALFAAAMFCFLFFRRRQRLRDLWPLCAALVAPAIYMAVALKTHLNLGLRHALPVYPFLFIFLGVVAAQAWRRFPKTSLVLIPLFILGVAAETLAAYPNFIPFFNVAAGGSRGGLKLLSDSNLDWGQDLKLVADWQKQHPERPVCLFYFGSADPAYYGIKYYKDWNDSTLPDHRQFSSQKFLFAISATDLQETYKTGIDPEFWSSFRNSPPVEIFGGSIYLYDPR